MAYTLHKVGWDTIGEAILVEEETTPSSCYLRDNARYFLEETQGDLTLVREGDTPVGVGKFSLLPDGSGWLETLRVRPAYQGRGVGKSLYDRWLLERETCQAPAIRMFTGTGNLRSKGLAERYGLSLAGSYIGATHKIGEDAPAMPLGFTPVSDWEKARALLEAGSRDWGRFFVMNNTFFTHHEANWRFLVDHHMLYADDEGNFVAIGARMLQERGLHVALYGGDGKRCMDFAMAYTAARKLPQCTVSYPDGLERVRRDMEREGFVHDAACRIVMERCF